MLFGFERLDRRSPTVVARACVTVAMQACPSGEQNASLVLLLSKRRHLGLPLLASTMRSSAYVAISSSPVAAFHESCPSGLHESAGVYNVEASR